MDGRKYSYSTKNNIFNCKSIFLKPYEGDVGYIQELQCSAEAFLNAAIVILRYVATVDFA